MIDLAELASAAKRKEDDKYRRKITHLWLKVGALNFMHGRFAERPLSFRRALDMYGVAFEELFRHKYVNARVTIESWYEDPSNFGVDFQADRQLTKQEQDRIARNLTFDIADLNQYLEEHPKLWYI